ncbi:MAG TPA: tetratricopeptide repeat protein, partial [Alphaproteobacteria bacterium]|nr:tetratricopeptide repeat protein [Alphaproteobacteria bacterium]
MLSQIGKKEDALEKWKKALELKPDYPDALSNMGHALWELGRFEEAQAACQKAIEVSPQYAAGYVNLGNALMSQGKLDEAIEVWKKAIDINPRQHHAFINIGNALRDQGKINESEEYCRKAIELSPDNPEALLNLANALRDQGNFSEAEANYKKAIDSRPQYAEAHNNLAIVLIDQIRFDEAATAAKYAIAFDPNHAGAHTNLANALREMGKFEEAEASARKALQLNSESVEARIDLADILYASDRLSEAETLFTEAMELVPDSPRLYIKLSGVLERANKLDEAIETIEKAIEKNPEMPEVYHKQAMVYMMANRIPEALAALDKALELNPKFPGALGTKSDILQTHGDMEGARKAAEEGLAMNDKIPFLYFTLSKVKKFTADDPHFIRMQEIEEDSSKKFGKAQAISLQYALSKAHEDVGNYEKAFEHLKKANDMKSMTVSFDRNAQAESYKKIKEFYTKEFFESVEGKGCDSDTPIFIVGMPRSGTTLTEQIISSHPDVFGAGELHYLSEVDQKNGGLSKNNCRELGEQYVEMIRAINDESKNAEKITDKMPGNYMRIGQIVATLPNAKIIHCRRNPVDTCLSCYKQLFARGHYWTYRLDDMAEHYALYDDMMNYWRSVLPKDRFLEIDYEETVNDFENQARRLIDYVGLEWNDACLTPHKTKRSIMTASKGQVRKPIYKTSVEAWRRYEDQLAGLAKDLEPFIRK